MVELQRFEQDQNIQELLRPEQEEGANPEAILEQRQTDIESRMGTVHERLSRRIRPESPGGLRGDLILDTRNPQGLAEQVRRDIFDALDDTRGDQTGRMTGGRAATHLEGLQWEERGEYTLKSLKSGVGRGRESLSVAKGMQDMIAHAYEQTRAELVQQQNDIQDHLDAQKELRGALGRVTRRVERTQNRFSKDIGKLLTALDNQRNVDVGTDGKGGKINLIVRERDTAVRITRRSMEAAIKNGTRRDDHGVLHFLQQLSTADNPRQHLNDIIRLCGLPRDDRSRNNVMEAAIQIMREDPTFQNILRSEELHSSMEHAFEGYAEREGTMRRTRVDYVSMRDHLEVMGARAQGNAPENKALLEAIETDLSRQSIPSLRQAIAANGFARYPDQCTDAERLQAVMTYLQGNQNILDALQPAVQSQLMTWLRGKTTRSLDREEGRELPSRIDKALEAAWQAAENLRTADPTLGSTAEGIRLGSMQTAYAQFQSAMQELQRVMGDNNNILSQLPPQHQQFVGERMEALQNLNQRAGELFPNLFEYTQHRIDIDARATRRQELETERVQVQQQFAQATRQANNQQGGGGGQQPNGGNQTVTPAETLRRRLEAIDKQLEPLQQTESPPDTSAFDTTFRRTQELFNGYTRSDFAVFASTVERERPGVTPDDINAAIANELQQKFFTQLESEFLTTLRIHSAQHTDMLNNLNKHVRVDMTFRETTGLPHLQLPEQARQGNENPTNLKLVRKLEGNAGIILEDESNYYVVRGEAVDGNQARENVGIYRKRNVNGRNIHSPQGSKPDGVGILFNVRLHS